MVKTAAILGLHRESYTSARILLNISNYLVEEKSISIVLLFCNSFYKFNNTEVRIIV